MGHTLLCGANVFGHSQQYSLIEQSVVNISAVNIYDKARANSQYILYKHAV